MGSEMCIRDRGVIHQQLAVCVLRKGVVFKEGDDPVAVLVTLAAENPNDHIDVMKILATMFSDPQKITQIAQAQSVEEIYNLFTNVTV